MAQNFVESRLKGFEQDIAISILLLVSALSTHTPSDVANIKIGSYVFDVNSISIYCEIVCVRARKSARSKTWALCAIVWNWIFASIRGSRANSI